MSGPTAAPVLAPLRVAGLTWRPTGQAVIEPPLLDRLVDLDRGLCELAARFDAAEHRFPSFLDAADLARVDYLRSFPQLATMALNLDARADNLARFADGPTLDADGTVTVTETEPVRHVLTPAACYHAYVHLQGRQLDAALHLGTRNTCYRREATYEPLRRQWCFEMREIVALGTEAEVGSFLEAARGEVDRLLDALGIAVTWCHATDPFFQPTRNPQYVMQRLDPVKHEAVFAGDLAIASANLHHDHFGHAFSIHRGGVPASSACIAFGLERWLYALAATYGPDPAAWPSVLEAVRDV